MPSADDRQHRQHHQRRPRVLARLAAVLVALAALVAGTVATAPQASARSHEEAVAWAAAQAGSTAWDNLCLKFVHDAYLNTGFDTSVLSSDNSSAISFWNTFAGFGDKYTDTNPPAGALVFWGPTSANPYGHVALAIGDGTAWSSWERTYRPVHALTIANRNAQGYPYLGYITFPVPQPGGLGNV